MEFDTSNMTVHIDSGSAAIVVPGKWYSDIITGPNNLIDCSQTSNFPTLSIVIKDITYTIEPEYYILEHGG